MRDNMLADIRSRGYWRINFQPLSVEDQIRPLKRCLDVVERNRVTARGWDYPHVPGGGNDKTSGIKPLENAMEAWNDWRNHKELWRMYQSSQFIHILALREDWAEQDLWQTSPHPPPPVLPGSILNAVSNAWTIAEVFTFLSRLGQSGLYPNGVRVSLKLMNTADRLLHMDDQGRVPLYGNYTTGASSLSYPAQELSPAEIAEPLDAATKAVLYFFDKFQWNPAEEQIKQLVNQLFKMR